jgi:uncharacterized protein with WD repeat
MDGNEQIEILKRNAKSDFELAKKEAKRKGKTIEGEFNEDDVDTSEVDPDGKYLKTWFYAPSTTIEQMEGDLLSNVFTLDAAHCNLGTMFICYG